MVLTVEELKERIRKPINRVDIESAIDYEHRIRMHVISYDSQPIYNRAFSCWYDKIQNKLTSYAFDLFDEYLGYPLKSVPLYQRIFNKLSKVFDANDSHKDVFFDDSKEEDKDMFKEDIKGLDKYFRDVVWNQVKEKPCSFMVFDFEEDSNSSDPIKFFVEIDDVIDCVFKPDCVTPEYFIYKLDQKQAIAIDDEKRLLFDISGNTPVLIKQVSTYTEGIPVRSLLSTKIEENPFKKGIPSVSSTLNLADIYLDIATSEDIPTLYALHPIISEYGGNEDYDSFGNDFDYERRVNDDGEEYGLEVNKYGRTRKEERDKGKERRGAGQKITKPVPKSDPNGDTIPDLGDPVTFINPDPAILERIQIESERRASDIFTNATGTSGSATDEQALNVEQILTLNEDEKTVLTRLSEDIAGLEKWCVDTLGELSYGDAYKGSIINYGTNFFLQSPQQIEENIKKAKEAGANESQLQVLNFMWIDSKFRNEKIEAERRKLIYKLEPFPNHSIQEMQPNRDVIDPVIWTIKLNFPQFIAKFEAEEVRISSFDDTISENQKLEFINTRLNTYAQQITQKPIEQNGE